MITPVPELSGATYLYAVATVSITFVGFAALLIVFRTSMGGALTRYDTYFTLSFIQIGFIVTAAALLPPMFAVFGWEPHTVWRVASGLIVIPAVWFIATVPARRRAATGARIPLFIVALLAAQSAAAAALAAIAAGMLENVAAGIYVSATTTILITSGIAYLMALGIMLPGMTKKKD